MSSNDVLEQGKAYQAIKRRLYNELGTRWSTGDKLPPIKQLARELDVGQTNTLRAVQELVREGLLASRPGHGTFVTPRAGAARTGRSSRHRLPAASAFAGVQVQLITSQSEPEGFIGAAISAFERYVDAGGGQVARSTFVPRQLLSFGIDENASAVCIVNPDSRVWLETGPSQPLVVVNTAVESNIGMTTGFDVVFADSQQGGMLAGRRMREIGVANPCFLGVSLDGTSLEPTSTARLKGFEQGFGQPVSPERILTLKAYMSTFGAAAVQRWLALSPRPDGIFAASDELAIGFIHGAVAHGLQAGRDFKIIGFDGQHKTRDLPAGPLTTLRAPMKQMGRYAAKLLERRLAQPGRIPRRIGLGVSLTSGDTA